MRLLVRVGAVTIIVFDPPSDCSAGIGSPADSSQFRSTKATHLSGHAGDPRTAAADTTSASQTN